MFTVAPREGPLPSPHPLCASPWDVGFVVLNTPGVHGAKTFIEHFIAHFPIFSNIKLLFLTLKVNKGKLIKLNFTRTVLHLASFWKWRFLKLENSPFLHRSSCTLFPPPPPKKSCITIVFDFSLDDCYTQEKLETMDMQNLGGKQGP